MTSGILLVDKPGGVTSHDVVARARRALGTRKVGHAGTLDPMATGLLILGVDSSTRLLTYLVGLGKQYTATIRLGQSSTTDDAEGELSPPVDATGLTRASLDRAIAALTGDISQIPSTFSAIKVDGRRSYERARSGEAVSLAARQVTVSRFEVLSERRSGPFLDLDVVVECSSGTYIRALARDVGATLGVGGHLTALRRTRVGSFGLGEAHTLERLADSAQLSYSLDAACLLVFPRRDLTDEEAESAGHGRALEPAGIDGVYAAVAPGGEVVALLTDEASRTRSVVVIRPATL